MGGSRRSHPRDRESTLILVADDEFLGRVVIAEELREIGYTVIEAVSGDEAAELIDLCPVDLVISDLKMPGRLDGAGLAAFVAEEYPALPVLLMSADAPDPAVLRQVEGFYSKPVPVDRICADVAALLDGEVSGELADPIPQLLCAGGCPG